MAITNQLLYSDIILDLSLLLHLESGGNHSMITEWLIFWILKKQKKTETFTYFFTGHLTSYFTIHKFEHPKYRTGNEPN